MVRTVARNGVVRLHSTRMSRDHPELGNDASRDEARRAGQLIAVATVLVAVAAGVLMRLLDRHEFPTIGSGLWWALQTVTTVGYGDHVPENTGGKALAGVVMVTGIGFLSVVTASISAAFVESARRRRGDDDIAERLERIEQALNELRATRVSPVAGDASSPGAEEGGGMAPNILVIWGDDIGITNLSCYSDGLMGYRTPNIDRIANEGVLKPLGYAPGSSARTTSATSTSSCRPRTGSTSSSETCTTSTPRRSRRIPTTRPKKKRRCFVPRSCRAESSTPGRPTKTAVRTTTGTARLASSASRTPAR
jgi:Ion channel/Sulfatase